MSDTTAGPASGRPSLRDRKRRARDAQRRRWNYQPDPPVVLAPFYDWPPHPMAVFKHVMKTWSPLSERFVSLLVAIVIWSSFSPSLERTATLQFDWIAEIWLRNLVLVLSVAGGLHLYLYRFKRQGDDLRYDTRGFAKNSKFFHFGNQVWDNMFWTLTTGVVCWTAWEVAMMWAYANGIARLITFESNPVWFIVLILLIPYWASFYFYWMHRSLHWRPLYRRVHSWHHKNVVTGPWSGLAMHPLEQFLLFGDTLLYLIVASHPIHVIFNFMFHGIIAPTSHAGFDAVRLTKRHSFGLGDFYHQLHHRFIDCNYGTVETPWDQWFGTYHDGTPQGGRQIDEMRRRAHEESAKTGRGRHPHMTDRDGPSISSRPPIANVPCLW